MVSLRRFVISATEKYEKSNNFFNKEPAQLFGLEDGNWLPLFLFLL